MNTTSIFYIGKKKIKRDSIAGTGHIWVGYGSSQDVESQAAQLLLLHHTVWVDEKTFEAIENDGAGDRMDMGRSLSDSRIDELSELLGVTSTAVDAIQEIISPMHVAVLAINELGIDALDPRLVQPVCVLNAGVLEIRNILNPADVLPGEPAPTLREATGPTANTQLTPERLVAAVAGIIKNLPADGYNPNGTPSIDAVRAQTKAQIGDVDIDVGVVREAFAIVKADDSGESDNQ